MNQNKQFINNKQELVEAVIKQYTKELDKYVEANENRGYFKFRIPAGFNIENGNEIVFGAISTTSDGKENVTELDFLDLAIFNDKDLTQESFNKQIDDMIYDVAKVLVDEHINELIELESDPNDLQYLEYKKKS